MLDRDRDRGKGLRDVRMRSPSNTSWSNSPKDSSSDHYRVRGLKDSKSTPSLSNSKSRLEDRDRDKDRDRDRCKGLRNVRMRSPSNSSWSNSFKDTGSYHSRVRGLNDSRSTPSKSKDRDRERDREIGKGLRDVSMRSPTNTSWSNSTKDSGSDHSRVRGRLRDSKSAPSRSSSKSKSPIWSRDSVGSEQSKCFEVKKQVDTTSSSNSSEMEEGELRPESQPQQVPKKARTKQPESVGLYHLEADIGQEPSCQFHTGTNSEANHSYSEMQHSLEDVEKFHDIGKPDNKQTDNACEGEDVENKADNLPNSESKTFDGTLSGGSGSHHLVIEAKNGGGEKLDEKTCMRKEVECEDQEEADKGIVVKKNPAQLEEEPKLIDQKISANDAEGGESNQELMEAAPSLAPEEDVPKDLAQSYKDKGKSVEVVPAHLGDSAEDSGTWVDDKEPRDLLSCRDNDKEGHISRGFDLFTNSPVRTQQKAEKSGANVHKDEKLALEPLELSLSLPNFLLPIGGTVPGSPDQARSVQSLNNTFCSNSDGFTASVSLSGSQSFYHNPSCSLNQNSLDNLEQSVGSRPIFQGIDWQVLSQNEPMDKESLYQKLKLSGNGSQQQSQAILNSHSTQAQHSRVAEGSSKSNGLERHLSFQRQLSGGQSRHHDDVKSPSHSAGSHDMRSNYSFDRRQGTREKSSGSLFKSNSQKEQERVNGGAEFVETVIARIVSDPLHVMARKFHEMTAQFVVRLKESILEIMLNVDKRTRLHAFQKALQDRSDITMEMLMKSHRSQLEILVALKTGLPEFLQQDPSVSSSDLTEIFLNLKCRNVACQSLLPVDECDCGICGKKNGFCSACMCLVCAKFDMASNTCSWVGCDVCLHWCHTDCALRKSYIRNGHSASGAEGMSEMQFHCVACNHPSEMFGFVKEVFQNFAKEWTGDTLCRELEYVQRIFAASKDLRGKRLNEIAGQMLERLADKSNLPEVYCHIMAFLSDGDSSKVSKTTLSTVKEKDKWTNGISGPSHETTFIKSAYPGKIDIDVSASLLPSYNCDRSEKNIIDFELHTSAQKGPVFDELESIVRIKQAEAKMFQSRANDARREAEGLNRISIAKNEKIEEEYGSRMEKLRLAEAEEMHRQKLEELQALERAHHEYFNMKLRMEADIKDLLLKMEATKRNFAM